MADAEGAFSESLRACDGIHHGRIGGGGDRELAGDGFPVFHPVYGCKQEVLVRFIL